MDLNDPTKSYDPQVFDDPKGISIGSMDLDNPNSTLRPPSSIVLFGLFPQCRQNRYYVLNWTYLNLSSPRAKRAGPKGLRAESARAVTVSQCPHSEVGQDFLLRRRVTLTEIAVTRKRKV